MDLVSELQLHTGFYCIMKTMMDVTGFPMLVVGGGGGDKRMGASPSIDFFNPPPHIVPRKKNLKQSLLLAFHSSNSTGKRWQKFNKNVISSPGAFRIL